MYLINNRGLCLVFVIGTKVISNIDVDVSKNLYCQLYLIILFTYHSLYCCLYDVDL